MIDCQISLLFRLLTSIRRRWQHPWPITNKNPYLYLAKKHLLQDWKTQTSLLQMTHIHQEEATLTASWTEKIRQSQSDQKPTNDRILAWGSHRLPNWMFFYTLCKRPLTPPPLGFTRSCCGFFWQIVEECVNVCRNIIWQNSA